MNPTRRSPLSDLRGAVRIATDATTGVTDLVEAVHGRVLRPPGLTTPQPDDRTGGLTGAVYRSVRAVQRGVGRGLEGLLGALEGLQGLDRPLGSSSTPAASSPRREAIVAALNGVIGDRLASAQNPLAVNFELKRKGRPLTLGLDAGEDSKPRTDQPPDPAGAESGQVLVLLHGLCMGDAQWMRRGHDHGSALERDLGLSAVHVQYNSGLAVSDNGALLADALERLFASWPVPIERLVLLGYSMGGLVARSAVHQAMARELAWPAQLSDVVFLGTPHHGAPLERIGSLVDGFLGLAPYAAPFARLGRVRSTGITDLRHGRLFGVGDSRHEERERRTARWPGHTTLHALAASTAKDPQGRPGSRPGDGLVPLDSALGRHPDLQRALPIGAGNQWVGWKLNHLDLLNDVGVYDRLHSSLSRPKR